MIIDYEKRLQEIDNRFKTLVLQKNDAEAQLAEMRSEMSRIQGEYRLMVQLRNEEMAKATAPDPNIPLG
jgi:chaperonin cofactor prefoldin